MRDILATIDWGELGLGLLSVLWDVTRLTTMAALVISYVAAIAAFTLIVLVLTGRLPWIVRRWL